MAIQILLAVEPGHCPSTTSSIVQDMPQCLDNLPIEHSRAWNKSGCVASVTFFHMAVNMEQSNTALDVEIIVELDEVFDSICSCEEVCPVLAHDIVKQ